MVTVQLVQAFVLLVLLWWLYLQGREIHKLHGYVRELRARVNTETMIRIYGAPDGLPRELPSISDAVVHRPYGRLKKPRGGT